mgnify:CR=1 FL=1
MLSIDTELLQSYVEFWKARITLNSEDPKIKTLLQYKFTNPYRLLDRGSQITYQKVIINSNLSQDSKEVLFCLFVHLHFNTDRFANKLIEYDLQLSNYNAEDFNNYLQQDKLKEERKGDKQKRSRVTVKKEAADKVFTANKNGELTKGKTMEKMLRK